LRQRQSRTCGRDGASLSELRRRGERKHHQPSLRPGDAREDASLAEFLLRRLRATIAPGTLGATRGA
jgi:hypothetical protein